jgi:hypothetical protein
MGQRHPLLRARSSLICRVINLAGDEIQENCYVSGDGQDQQRWRAVMAEI